MRFVHLERKMKLDEQTIMDLSDNAVERCAKVLRQSLQLVDEPDQMMIVSAMAAAHCFGVAARCMQYGMQRKNGGEMPDFAETSEAVVKYILEIAKKNPPDAPKSLRAAE